MTTLLDFSRHTRDGDRQNPTTDVEINRAISNQLFYGTIYSHRYQFIDACGRVNTVCKNSVVAFSSTNVRPQLTKLSHRQRYGEHVTESLKMNQS